MAWHINEFSIRSQMDTGTQSLNPFAEKQNAQLIQLSVLFFIVSKYNQLMIHV